MALLNGAIAGNGQVNIEDVKVPKNEDTIKVRPWHMGVRLYVEWALGPTLDWGTAVLNREKLCFQWSCEFL